MNRFYFNPIIALLSLTIALQGCGGMEEDIGELAEDGEETRANESYNASVTGFCAIGATAAGALAGAAVWSATTTGVCVSGTLVTTLGTTTALCLVPATAAAATFIGGLVVGGVYYLACQNAAGTMDKVRVRVKGSSARNTPCTTTCQCSDGYYTHPTTPTATASNMLCASATLTVKGICGSLSPRGKYHSRHCSCSKGNWFGTGTQCETH
jgi:hypothetical protein